MICFPCLVNERLFAHSGLANIRGTVSNTCTCEYFRTTRYLVAWGYFTQSINQLNIHIWNNLEDSKFSLFNSKEQEGGGEGGQ